MLCENDLGRQDSEMQQGNNQIKDSLAHNRNVDGKRGLEKSLPSFWAVKGMEGKYFQTCKIMLM